MGAEAGSQAQNQREFRVADMPDDAKTLEVMGELLVEIKALREDLAQRRKPRKRVWRNLPRHQDEVTLQAIVEAIAQFYGCPVEDLRERYPDKSMAWRSQCASVVLADLCGMNNSQIGAALNRHPSTITYTLQSLEQRLEENPRLQAELNRLGEFVAQKFGFSIAAGTD